MSSESRSVSELKQKANTLKFALSLATKHYYNLNSNEPTVHLPSLQQCIESMSHAYGFKSFNSFIQSEKTELKFDSQLFLESILLQLRKVNNFDEHGMRFAAWWLALDIDAKIAKNALELFDFFESLPFSNALKQPQLLYTDLIDLSDYEGARRGTKCHLRFAEYILAHIVDGQVDGSVFKNETEESTLYFLPLSRIYKNKIMGDLNQARSIIKYIVDDINLSGILSAHQGELNFDSLHNSVINVVVDSNIAKEIEMFCKTNVVLDELLGRFHSVLEVYPKTVIDFKRVSKLKGYDLVKYSTYKYFLIKILLGLIYENLDDSELTEIEKIIKKQYKDHSKGGLIVRNMATITHPLQRDTELQIHRLASLNPHSSLINEAIIKFDDCFARYIYPLFDIERKGMNELKRIAKVDGNFKKEKLPMLIKTSSLTRLGKSYESELYHVECNVVTHKVSN